MSRPRVALIVPVFPVLSETFIVRQWLGLLGRGWDVHVVCGRFDRRAWGRTEALAERDDLRRRVHAVGPTESKARAALHAPVVAAGLLARPGSAWAHARGSRGPVDAARRLYLDAPLLRLRPDLVHFEFGGLAPGRMDLGDRLGAKLVVSFRGFDLNYVGLSAEAGVDDFYEPVWRRADRLHLLGEDLWRRAVARGCPADKPHSLIPPAVDAERFRPAGERPLGERAADGPLRILSVGRLEWKKGYDYALRAVGRLLEDGVAVRYTLVGGGSELSSLAYARHELGLGDAVELIGPLPHGEVLGRLREADVFLHPAVSEGFCNAVLEAQAVELPAVVTDADGLGENVAHRETGFVVPRRDPGALADALAELARDPELRRRMGRAGRARVREHFRPDQELDGFERLYRDALGSTEAS